MTDTSVWHVMWGSRRIVLPGLGPRSWSKDYKSRTARRLYYPYAVRLQRKAKQ